MSAPSELGRGGWIDLTVGDAAALRDFYAAVVGWRSEVDDLDESLRRCQARGGALVRAVCALFQKA